jgi:hypothetical protein
LRRGDGLGCPSSRCEYRDSDRRITTDHVRLVALSRSRPYWLDEALSADWVHPHRRENSNATVLAVASGIVTVGMASVAAGVHGNRLRLLFGVWLQQRA